MKRTNALFVIATMLATGIVLVCSYVFNTRELLPLLFLMPGIWIFILRKKQRQEK